MIAQKIFKLQGTQKIFVWTRFYCIKPQISIFQNFTHKNFLKAYNVYSKSTLSSTENRIYTIPNLLCLYRIGIAPIISYELIFANYFAACGFMVTAAFSDLVDGYIARNFKNQKSLIGSFLDPLADKILVFTLSMSLWHINLLPSYLMGLFVSRDILLTTGASYWRYKTLEKYSSLKDIINPKLTSEKIDPLLISKINTFLQFALICTSMGIPIGEYGDSPYLLGLQIICCATTLGSGFAYLSYLSSNRLRNLFKR